MSALDNLIAVAGMDPNEALEDYRQRCRTVATLKNEEADILGRLAGYRSQFGPGGHFDHERKALLAAIVESRRAALEESGGKVVEAALDSYGRATPEYRDWLTRKVRERTEMHELEAELARQRAWIEYAEGEREYAKQRVRLAEELIRYSRAEMGLTR